MSTSLRPLNSALAFQPKNVAWGVATAELRPLQRARLHDFLPVCCQLFNPWMPMKAAAYSGADLKVSISIARRRIQASENRCTKCLLCCCGSWRVSDDSCVRIMSPGPFCCRDPTRRFLKHLSDFFVCVQSQIKEIDFIIFLKCCSWCFNMCICFFA